MVYPAQIINWEGKIGERGIKSNIRNKYENRCSLQMMSLKGETLSSSVN